MLGGWLGEAWATADPLAWAGVTLAHPLYAVFVCSTLARLMVALYGLGRLRELRSVRKLTARGLIFRFTRLYPPAGMSLQLISSFRKRPVRRSSD